MKKQQYNLKVWPAEKMRYLTTGDYIKNKTSWDIISADFQNPDYNFLTMVHELLELYLTQKNKISDKKIMKFDVWFEKEKAKGKFKKFPSPGWHPKAPYRHEHIFAHKIEMLLAKELGVNKNKYEKADDALCEKIKRALDRKS